MIAVIFEVEFNNGRIADYFDIVGQLRPELQKIDGFISVERFESTEMPGRFVSISFWRDDDAVTAWRTHDEHRLAQQKGKAGIIKSYRIRVGEVLRDYSGP
jgi:heme-degrading monooxygenase HmoA